MTSQYKVTHPNHFSSYFAITTADTTEIVPAVSGYRIFITDIDVQTAQAVAVGSFTLQDSGSVSLYGPFTLADTVHFQRSFISPIINETRNDAVSFVKTAAEDNWEVFISGYYEA